MKSNHLYKVFKNKGYISIFTLKWKIYSSNFVKKCLIQDVSRFFCLKRFNCLCIYFLLSSRFLGVKFCLIIPPCIYNQSQTNLTHCMLIQSYSYTLIIGYTPNLTECWSAFKCPEKIAEHKRRKNHSAHVFFLLSPLSLWEIECIICEIININPQR